MILVKYSRIRRICLLGIRAKAKDTCFSESSLFVTNNSFFPRLLTVTLLSARPKYSCYFYVIDVSSTSVAPSQHTFIIQYAFAAHYSVEVCRAKWLSCATDRVMIIVFRVAMITL